jgi:hypothetical protein
VVVFVREHRDACLRALRALDAQAREVPSEVLVADGSDEASDAWLLELAPRVRHLRLGPASMPVLKAAAIRAARGSIIAILDPLDVPERGWLRAIRHALMATPEAAAVGGAVLRGGSPSMGSRAGYLFEYGAFSPPFAEGRTDGDLPGNNVAYRREVLLDWCADLLEAGFWKPFFHERIRARGGPLILDARLVVRHETDHGFWQFGLRRFHYGRCFGAMRLAAAPRRKRFLYRVAGAAVPLLLVARHTRRNLVHARNRGILLGCWPALWGICVLWGLGECLGYWRGPGRSCSRVY